MEAIREFRGDYYFLSNFYPAKIYFNGIEFQNNEAAFQAMKTKDRAIVEKFANLSPSEAKKLGRKIPLRPDWEKIKYDFMYMVCIEKFKQNPELLVKLLATGDARLIEGNDWHDNTWGSCWCSRCENVMGENHLGRTLYNVRNKLR